jgi:hypothetical protein
MIRLLLYNNKIGCFISVLLCLCCSCKGRTNIECLDIIHHSKSKIQLNPVSFNTTEVRTLSALFNYSAYDSVYFLKECVLNEEKNIKHTFGNFELKGLLDVKDTLSIHNQKFCIQDLLNDSSQNIVPVVVSAYTFENNHREILFLRILNTQERRLNVSFNIFFDITEVLKVYPIGKTSFMFTTSLDCLGDFDGDGIVELLHFGEDTLSVFQIATNSLEKVTDKFIIVKKDVEEHYQIDRKNSNWFFPMNRYQKNVECIFEYEQVELGDLYLYK